MESKRESNSHLVTFDSSEPNIAHVGGKGASLMKMTQFGLQVPPGFICTVLFFEEWMSTLSITPEVGFESSSFSTNNLSLM